MIGSSFPFGTALSWPLRLIRLGGLVVLVVSVTQVGPAPGWSGRPLVLTVLLAVASAGWVLWVFADGLAVRWQVCALLLMGTAGGLLAGLSPAGVAVAFAAVALMDAATRLRHLEAVALSVVVLAATAAGHLVTGPDHLLEQTLVLVSSALVGAFRWQQLRRIEQGELLRAHVQRAVQEEARAATLAERSRIARELHDVQAHALAALSVQLKVIDALVEDGGDAQRVRASVGRAEQLTREGLVETRRAILALRDEVLPIDDLLASLAAAYVDRHGEAAVVTVGGAPVALPTDTTMALYRVAQEALTNVRKHAEGSPVRIGLDHTGTGVVLTVDNELGAASGPLADAGSGHGLPGLRERVEALGGEVTAEVCGAGWRLRAEVPL